MQRWGHVISVESLAQPIRPDLQAPVPPTLEQLVYPVHPLVIVGRVLTHPTPVPRLKPYGMVLQINIRRVTRIILDVGFTILSTHNR
jgi:hypothetical protein